MSTPVERGGPASESEGETTPLARGNIVVVSNRQPYSHGYGDDGSISVSEPAGGLTSGLDPVMQRADGTWIAWGDGEADREVTDDGDCIRVPPEDPSYTLRRIWLSDQERTGYYLGYSNQVLWPLCHSTLGKVRHSNGFGEQYREVNERFADAVVEETGPSPMVWFQDYHFGLAPRLVREQMSDAYLLHFWHIPWPSWDVFRACPEHRELLDGLLGNDLIGFHVERYCQNFLDCVDAAFEDADVHRGSGSVHLDGHETVVRAFPMGVDAERIQQKSYADEAAVRQRLAREFGIPEETKLAVGVDRLDYSKGIVKRLEAFERLWEEYPEWQEEVTYFQKASQSRSRIPEYQKYQTRVTETVERINQRFGTDHWQPVVYTERMLPAEILCSIYRHADVGVVSAIRDGMNLVAQEYLAAQVDDDGILVLSDQTGVHDVMGEDALTINPHDTCGFTRTLDEALSMDDDERRRRCRSLREQVEANTIYDWMDTVGRTAQQLR